MKRASSFLYFLSLVFLSLSFLVPMTSRAASYSCRFSCMRVRVGTCHQVSTGLDIEGFHVYEKREQTPVLLDLADTVDANSCSAGECAQRCRTACGGRNIGERAESSWLNGEQACLNDFPGYLAVAGDSCDSFNGAEIRSLDLINGEFVRLQGEVSHPLCTVRSGAPTAPVTGGGSTDSATAPAACREATTAQRPAEGQPRGTCSFSCIHPGESRSVIMVDPSQTHTTETVTQRPGEAPVTTVRSTLHSGEVASCVEATFEPRVGSSCTPGTRCDCEQQCVAACGSDTHGKSYCFLGADDPRQTPICATSAAQGTAPRCGNGSPTTLTNPLGTTSISELIARLVRAITGIAGSMALLMFVVGGVMWMTAEGSDRVGTAQTILKNASIGLVLIFLAYSLVSLFLSVLGL